MSDDLPPDLPRLRTLERYLQLELEEVRAAIRRLEQTPEPTPARPSWLAEYDGQRLVQIHRGDCNVTGPHTKAVDEDVARRGIVEAGACQYCRPDRAIGVLG